MSHRPRLTAADADEVDKPAAGRATQKADPALVASAFETISFGLMVLDETGRILSANAMVLSDFGYEDTELVGRKITALLPGPSRNGYSAVVERHRRMKTAGELGTGFDVEGVRRDGTTFPVHVGLRDFVHNHETYYLCACRDTTQRREYRSLAGHRARHDRTTGCLNLFGIEDFLEEVTERPDVEVLAVIHLVLDGLDDAGRVHSRVVQAGLLAEAVARLRGALREQDKLARVGRNEFVAVVVLDPGATGVEPRAQELVASLATPLEIAGWQVATRASIGISLYPDHARTPQTLLDRAEAAMQHARYLQTGEAQVFSLEDQRRDEERNASLEAVRAAVDRNEFVLHFQPQFDLTTLATTGLEALLRWRRTGQGLVSPGEFLPMLEECGLMATVSRWVLSQAVAVNARFIAHGVLDVPVGVNVGPEIFEDPGFPELVAGVLAEHGLPADRLEIEITEATAITDPDQVAANAEALRSRGIGVAIDDFGTGFSSLKRLRLTNFSKLKIDRAFVTGLPGDAGDQTVITALLDLADGLNMDAVAEGIETEHELANLRMLGCRFGQGFWYARPMPEDQLRSWVSHGH